MKVLIVGGGIGGLSAAISLQQQGHDTVICKLRWRHSLPRSCSATDERVKESKPIGAAISVWSNGIKVLNALGLSQQVAQHGGRMDEMAYRWFEDGQYMCRFSLEPLYTQVNQNLHAHERHLTSHPGQTKSFPYRTHTSSEHAYGESWHLEFAYGKARYQLSR